MDSNVGMTIDKLPDPGGAMGREIICNNVNLPTLGQAGHNLFKESNKLRTGVTRCGLAQHLAGLCRSALPGESGKTGSSRSRAWMALFSSTQKTAALTGGFRYKPMMSAALVSKSGSLLAM